jgi:AcrR family transcriptional regulator
VVTRTRTRLSGPQRRDQILAATEALAGRAGFHALSMEAVARAAGVTRPVVYGHFGDLPGLVDALLDRVTEEALAQLEEVMPDRLPIESTRDALLAAVRGYLEAVRAHPHTWRLILMPPEGAPDTLRARVTAAREEVFARLEASLREGFAEGRGSPDPEITAHMASAYSDELARLVLTEPARYPIERLMEHTTWMVDALLAERA